MKRAVLPLVLSLFFLITPCLSGAPLDMALESGGLSLYDLYVRRDGEGAYASPGVDGGASLHIFLLNSSERVINIKDLSFSGVPITTLLEQRKVYWHDINPVRLEPGSISCVKIRLARYSDYSSLKELEVSAESDDGSSILSTFRLSEGKKNLHLSYVGYKGEKAYIYFTSTQQEEAMERIQKVLMDNVDVTENIEEQYVITDDHGLVILKFPEPLPLGEYHTLTLLTAKNDGVSYQVRVIEPRFPVGMYGAFTLNHLNSYRAHGANMYLSFQAISEDKIESLGKNGMEGLAPLRWDSSDLTEQIQQFKDAPGLYGFYLMDEPDVLDYRTGGGLGSTGPELVKRINKVREVGTSKPIVLAIDNTYRPNNWYVYGEMADIIIGHRYPVSGGFLGPMGLVDVTRHVVLASAPRPTYSIAQFFTYPPEPMDSIEAMAARKSRMPLPIEMWLQVIMAYAKGAKGISYYIHSGSKVVCGGTVPQLYETLKDVNTLAKKLSGLCAIGDWVPLVVSCNNENVDMDTILCGDEGLLVFFINLDFDSAPTGFTSVPQKDVKVEIKLPDGLCVSSAIRFNGSKEEPISMDSEDKPSTRVSLLSLLGGRKKASPISINLDDTGSRVQLSLDELTLTEVVYLKF